jgi:hypothetical protein
VREGAASVPVWPRQRGRRRRLGAEAEDGVIIHVRVISWIPAELHMFIRIFNPFEMHRLYRARKSAVVKAEAVAVAAGGDVSRR